MMILNLTQHPATTEQVAAGVVEPADKAGVQSLLTFEQAPDTTEMIRRAAALVQLAKAAGAEAVMIGGAPFFMAPLESALVEAGVQALYSFTHREAMEEKQPDGSVRKMQVFRHVGFVGGAMKALRTKMVSAGYGLATDMHG